MSNNEEKLSFLKILINDSLKLNWQNTKTTKENTRLVKCEWKTLIIGSNQIKQIKLKWTL